MYFTHSTYCINITRLAGGLDIRRYYTDATLIAAKKRKPLYFVVRKVYFVDLVDHPVRKMRCFHHSKISAKSLATRGGYSNAPQENDKASTLKRSYSRVCPCAVDGRYEDGFSDRHPQTGR